MKIAEAKLEINYLLIEFTLTLLKIVVDWFAGCDDHFR